MAGPIGGAEQTAGANGALHARRQLTDLLRETRRSHADQESRRSENGAKHGIRTLSLMNAGGNKPVTGGNLDVLA